MTARLDTLRHGPIGSRWFEVPAAALVIPGAAAAGGIAFLAWRPGVARSMLGSPRAVGFSLLIGALVFGAGWLLPRLGGSNRTTVVVQAVPVIFAFVVAVLPAFHNVTVDEAFPGTAAGSSSSGPPAAATVGGAALHGIDHDAVGDVLLVRTSNGYVVRFESLDVEPGPDYQVHIVPGDAQDSPDGGVHLGRLRGNKGNQNYAVPANAVLDRPLSVLIWCRAFAVPVAAATIH